jgi:O-methyltransferase involved in polyketide biosynthesis
MYLTAAAVDEVLAFVVNNSGRGSSIVIDYYFKSAIDGTSELEEARKMREFHRKQGEPFIFGIEEEGIEQFFASRGFNHVRSVTGIFLEKEYFKRIGRDTKVTHYYGITHATI